MQQNYETNFSTYRYCSLFIQPLNLHSEHHLAVSFTGRTGHAGGEQKWIVVLSKAVTHVLSFMFAQSGRLLPVMGWCIMGNLSGADRIDLGMLA